MGVASLALEAGRKAHELSVTRGANAYAFAAKMAAQALAADDSDEHAFWRAVAACLAPRSPAD